MDAETRRRLIEDHLDAIRKLEIRAAEAGGGRAWPPDRYYFLWHVVVGAMLGAIGALASLVGNTVGAPLFGHRSLELIRVYLTFPMGEQALSAETGFVLFVGCCLYLATGVLYGVAFHLAFSLFFADAPRTRQIVASSLIGVGLWIVNFYLVLSWLQPLLLGGDWIVRLVPWWVGLLTHLSFVWAMLLGEAWGRFEPYRAGSRVVAGAG